jgi:hypothetical protein
MTGRDVLNRVLTLTVCLLLVMLTSILSAPAFADNLNITGGVPGVACANPTVSSGSISFSCPPSPLSGTLTSSGAGNLSTGVFGAATEVSGVPLTGGSTSADVFVTYNFTVSGVANGTAQFDISAPGIISCVGCNLRLPESGQAFGFFIDGNGESINGGPLGAATNVALANGANNFVVDTSISNGTAQLFFGLEIGTTCDPSVPCTASSDFLDPTSITRVIVFDANGNLVSGASLVSDSGFNPNVGSPSPTPEPSGALLFGTGLLVLIGVVRLKTAT